MKNTLLFLMALVALLPAVAGPAVANGNIVVSVKPLHSLVANISKGISSPTLILSRPGSPHTSILKPSDAAAIAQAKLIFWIGPQLETFLQKPIATINRNATVISFWQADPRKDPHLWLNPKRAEKMVEKIAAALAEHDPKNAANYKSNLQDTLKRLDILDKDLSKQLANTNPFLVFHNAYSHLAERYNLKIAGTLVSNPELRPGAKRIGQIRQILKNSGIACLFAEPQFSNKIIANLISGTDTKLGTLDPLGSDIPAGPEHYFKMMRQLADNLSRCG